MKTPSEKPLLAMSPRALVAKATLQPELGYPTAQPTGTEKWSYTKFKQVVTHILRAKNVLAHTVRVRHKNGTQVQVWLQKGEAKIWVGQGRTFAEALDNIFLAPLKAKEEEAELASVTSVAPVEAPAR